jgi:hypothetical protein
MLDEQLDRSFQDGIVNGSISRPATGGALVYQSIHGILLL